MTLNENQAGRYGSADKWFGLGVSLLVLGTGVFGSSFSNVVPEWVTGFRFLALVAIAVGALVTSLGIAVWQYNLRHPGPRTLTEELSTRRALLEAERAGLRAAGDEAKNRSINLIVHPVDDATWSQLVLEETRNKVRLAQVQAELATVHNKLAVLAGNGFRHFP